MMSSEALLYLSARRPGGHDDADPAIAEALAKTATDPALGAWAADQQRVDTAIALKLAEVEPPADLRATILAGGKVSRRTWWRWLNRRSFGVLRYWEVVAIAAILMVCAVLSAAHFLGSDGAANWQRVAATAIERIESGEQPLGQTIKDVESIRRWLTEQRAPAPGNLPAALVGLRAHGCAIIQAGKEQVSIVCFPLGGGKEIHLVTISRSRLRTPPPEGSPRFETINGFMTAAWSDGGLAMMLLGKVEESDLRNLFAAKTAAAKLERLPLARSFILRPARVPRSS